LCEGMRKERGTGGDGKESGGINEVLKMDEIEE
jgi:hypothetical protein